MWLLFVNSALKLQCHIVKNTDLKDYVIDVVHIIMITLYLRNHVHRTTIQPA